MDDFLFDLMLFSITVAVFLIAGYLVPWLRQQVNGTRYERAFDAISDAVAAAEQIMGENYGANKKKMVTEYATDLFGKVFTDAQIDTMIEAAVYALKQAKKDGA